MLARSLLARGLRLRPAAARASCRSSSTKTVAPGDSPAGSIERVDRDLRLKSSAPPAGSVTRAAAADDPVSVSRTTALDAAGTVSRSTAALTAAHTTAPPVGIPPALFDTYEVVRTLEGHGLSRRQSDGILGALRAALHETSLTRDAVVASRAEVAEVERITAEKVFNATIKFENAQQFQRALLEKDMGALRGELRAAERQDIVEMLDEIHRLEKVMLSTTTSHESKLAALQAEIIQTEKRMLQLVLGGIVSIITIALTVGLRTWAAGFDGPIAPAEDHAAAPAGSR